MEEPVEIRRRESIKPVSVDGPVNGVNGGLVVQLPNGSAVGHFTYQSPEEEDDTVLAVTCRVCQTEIIIDKEEGFVVKCAVCNEATPIRNAPVGEKYVRCPCHCLLICKDSSEKIACPRVNCKRIITISGTGTDGRQQPPFATQLSPAGTVRVVCVHCDQDFLFNIIQKSLAKCPHCSKISAVGNVFRRRQLRVYSFVAFLFILITALVIFATGFLLAESGGIVALYIGLVTISVLALVRVGYFLRMRVSQVQETV